MTMVKKSALIMALRMKVGWRNLQFYTTFAFKLMLKLHVYVDANIYLIALHGFTSILTNNQKIQE